jgi:aspartate aminotransferase
VPISAKVKGFMSSGSWIRRMFEQGLELRTKHGAENVFDFTLGNPEMDPPEPFVRKLRELCTNPVPGMHLYMPNPGYGWARDKVAAALAADTGVPLEGRHVIMTTGAACALNIALKALLDPGDEVLVMAPYFVEYLFYVDNHGGVVKLVDTDEHFLPKLDAIEQAIGPQTKAIILNSPNNPTGAVYPRSLLQGLADLLETAGKRIGHPIYVLSDEPYRKIYYGEKPVSALSVFRNCLYSTSHSKDLAVPGERIGAAAVHPDADDGAEIVAAMTFALRTLGFVNAPSLMQHAVAACQDVSVDVAEYRIKRDMLVQGLTDAGYDCPSPGGAFYVFPKSPIADDVAFVRMLLEERVLGVPGSGFGRAGHFRLAYCVRREVIERALPGLRRVRSRC